MPTRRAVLAGLGATASAVALAGCNGNPLGGDGGSPASEYTDWMPATDQDQFTFSVLAVGDLAGVDELPEGMLPEQLYGVDVEDFDQNLSYSNADVLEGSFERETVRQGIENDLDLTLQEDGEYADFTRYGVDGLNVDLAIREGAVVIAPTDQLESVVDAERGETDRIVDASDDFDLLTTELGTGDLVSGSLRSSTGTESNFFGANELASGQRADVSDSDTEVTHVFVFGTEDDVDESGVRGRYENQSNTTDVSSSADGRVATVDYTVPTGDFF